jgi:hypothetical protein
MKASQLRRDVLVYGVADAELALLPSPVLLM